MYRRFLVLLVVAGLWALPSLCSKSVAQDDVKEKAVKQKDTVKEEEPKEIREPDVIYVPTPRDVVAKMLEIADVKKGDVAYDLGCGDGRIVAALAKKGAKATGFDIDPARIKDSRATMRKTVQSMFRDAEAAITKGDWATARQKAAEASTFLNLAEIQQKDIFTLDLSDANVITLYLLPTLNVKLIPQLEKLKPGSRIVSHDFEMAGVTPDKVVEFKGKDGGTHPLYLWTTPLKKEKKEEK
jgi:SAM-dependent methyltransferase